MLISITISSSILSVKCHVLYESEQGPITQLLTLWAWFVGLLFLLIN